jgi:hypothetical protein
MSTTLDAIDEMTNVPDRVHGLGEHLLLYVYQSDKGLPHADRIKVYHRGNREDSYSIDLRNDPAQIVFRNGPYHRFLTIKEEAAILDHIRTHRTAYIKMTHDPEMSLFDLENEIKCGPRP